MSGDTWKAGRLVDDIFARWQYMHMSIGRCRKNDVELNDMRSHCSLKLSVSSKDTTSQDKQLFLGKNLSSVD